MNTFEKIIKDYIESACKTDAVLAGKYEKSGKDIAGCCKYIKAEAKKKAKNLLKNLKLKKKKKLKKQF